MEIIKSSNIYKFKPPLPKVHFIQPAFDDSIVLIYQVDLGRDGLKHISSVGKQLYCHFFPGLVDTLAMPSQTQAVILLVASNQIFTLNLNTRTPTLYNHYYKIQDSCQVKLQTFYNTRLVCIRENGAYNNHILKLTYYKYPFQCNSQKICQKQCQFEGVEGEWTYQYTIRKGNDRSMILWYKSRHDEQFEIRMFDIENYKGNYRTIRIRNSLGDAYGIDHINCSFQQVWEMSRNVFCIVATTEKNEKKCVNSRGNVINNFIWQVDKQIIRQAPFQFDPKFNNFLIECLPFGKYSMFRTIYTQNGTKFVPSPAIYVDNSSEKVVANEMWEFNHFSRWIFPGYSDSLVVQAKFDNPVYEITLMHRLLPSRKILSYHLMAQSEMQELDFDLKNQIVELLDYEQK